jgi:hypothetical protein
MQFASMPDAMLTHQDYRAAVRFGALYQSYKLARSLGHLPGSARRLAQLNSYNALRGQRAWEVSHENLRLAAQVAEYAHVRAVCRAVSPLRTPREMWAIARCNLLDGVSFAE